MHKLAILSLVVFLFLYGCMQQSPSAPHNVTGNQTTVNGTPPQPEPCASLRGEARDRCYLNLHNETLCEKIEEKEIRERCWYQFIHENHTLRACERFSILKDDCIELLAKNETDCQGIANTTRRDSCVRRWYKDPCADKNGTERALCIYTTNHTLTCRDFECITIIANFTKQPSLCKNIQERPAYMLACEEISGEKNACMRGDDGQGYVKSLCYQIVAEFTLRPNVCSLANISLYRDKCYQTMAVRLKDENYCLYSSNDDVADDCYREVAKVKGAYVCEKVKRTAWYDVCFFDAAKVFHDPRMCNGVRTVEMQRICYGTLTMNEQYVFPPAYCGEIRNTEWKDQCYFFRARILRNSTLCAEIEYQPLRERCAQVVSLGR